MKRDLKVIVERARSAGWTVTHTGGGHLRFCPPREVRSPCIFAGSTPSDHRALANLQSMLRRAGLETRPKAKKAAKR